MYGYQDLNLAIQNKIVLHLNAFEFDVKKVLAKH